MKLFNFLQTWWNGNDIIFSFLFIFKINICIWSWIKTTYLHTYNSEAEFKNGTSKFQIIIGMYNWKYKSCNWIKVLEFLPKICVIAQKTFKRLTRYAKDFQIHPFFQKIELIEALQSLSHKCYLNVTLYNNRDFSVKREK